MTPTSLRVVGTSYRGKQPREYTADVLRTAVRAAGVDMGFEDCLTSRPFTARTLIAGHPGMIAPGHGNATGRDRAVVDLADGLETLAGAGFRITRVHLPDVVSAPAGGPTVVVGPLQVFGRWAQPDDRLMLGEVWRHVTVDQCTGDEAICLDPTVGGYTALPLAELSRPDVTAHLVQPPDGPLDITALARRCLARGAAWRAAADGDDRDERGLAAAATNVNALTFGGAPRRLRLSTAAYGLHSMRAGALLGMCGTLSIDQLALADILTEVVTRCRLAQAALRGAPPVALVAALRGIASAAEAAGELYRRIAAAG